jgi:hypothetical protein
MEKSAASSAAGTLPFPYPRLLLLQRQGVPYKLVTAQRLLAVLLFPVIYI